jgi:hypothetical protein
MSGCPCCEQEVPGCCVTDEAFLVTFTNALQTTEVEFIKPPPGGIDWIGQVSLKCDTGAGVVDVEFSGSIGCEESPPESGTYRWFFNASVNDNCDFGLLTYSWTCDPILIEFDIPALECSAINGCTVPATHITVVVAP